VVEAFHDLPVSDVGERVVDVRQSIGGDLRRLDERVLDEHVADDDGRTVPGARRADDPGGRAAECDAEDQAAEHARLL
jgi:hypothetical protein